MSSSNDRLTALWASHHRLDAATKPLTDEEIAGPSYCADWSTAQVLSHIGSGAQIFGLLLDAGLSGAEAPGRIGGADDHAGIDIGRTFTETPRAATPAEFLAQIRAGNAVAHGEQGAGQAEVP